MTTYKGYFECCGCVQRTTKEKMRNEEIKCKQCGKEISKGKKDNLVKQFEFRAKKKSN